MDELLLELMRLVESTAPELWRIAEKQVSIQQVQLRFFLAIVGPLAVLCLLGIGICLYQRAQKRRDSRYVGEEEALATVLGITAIVLWLAFGFGAAHYASMRMNPEYHAIKVLLELVGQ